ncbi:MAG TPA: hypothetical protein PLR18_00065 [bacterium]|nr:hypothetical protein [bacterium]
MLDSDSTSFWVLVEMMRILLPLIFIGLGFLLVIFLIKRGQLFSKKKLKVVAWLLFFVSFLVILFIPCDKELEAKIVIAWMIIVVVMLSIFLSLLLRSDKYRNRDKEGRLLSVLGFVATWFVVIWLCALIAGAVSFGRCGLRF